MTRMKSPATGVLFIVVLGMGVSFTVSVWPQRNGKVDTKYAEDLAAFFKEMETTYPFFDLKDVRRGWPALKMALAKRLRRCRSDPEFLGIVLDAIRYLRDGHMGFVKMQAKLPPSEPDYYPGLSFLPATKNRVVVMSAPRKFASSLKPGTVVTHIDGKNARAYLEARAKAAWAEGGFFSSPQRARLFEFRIALRGKKGKKHRITYLAGRRRRTLGVVSNVEARGWPHTYNMPKGLTRHGRSSLYGELPSGVGYIYLRRIDGSTEPGIAAALSSHEGAKGWIVDLRGNGGGGYSRGLLKKIAGLPRPVAVLIDAGCYSAGETLARDLVRYAQARLFGARTAGSSSAKRYWTFPSGIATLSVPVRSRSGLKRCIEFFGILPQEEVEAEPEEVLKGQNSGILRAEEYLLGEWKKGERRKRGRAAHKF